MENIIVNEDAINQKDHELTHLASKTASNYTELPVIDYGQKWIIRPIRFEVYTQKLIRQAILGEVSMQIPYNAVIFLDMRAHTHTHTHTCTHTHTHIHACTEETLEQQGGVHKRIHGMAAGAKSSGNSGIHL